MSEVWSRGISAPRESKNVSTLRRLELVTGMVCCSRSRCMNVEVYPLVHDKQRDQGLQKRWKGSRQPSLIAEGNCLPDSRDE
jgi:hypothetical protein